MIMAKQFGGGDNLYIAQYDLSSDTQMLGNVGGGPAALDVTTIDESAYSRLGGHRDGRIEFTSFLDTAAGRSHPVLSALPRTDVPITYCRGTTLGSPAASATTKQVNYDGNRGTDGLVVFSVSAQANSYGLVWGRQLTAGKRTDTAATNGTGIDTTASASFGWSAYLHVFSFTGTSVTVTIQDSADNATYANLSGGAFTAATGATSERIAGATTTATVRRYVRVITSGTFSSAVFAVNFSKGESPGTVF